MDDPNCECKVYTPDDLPEFDLEATNQEDDDSTHCYNTIRFVPTFVGKSAKDVVYILNDSKETQTYLVQRDPHTNPIYHAFECKLANIPVKSGDYLEIIITYRPQVPNETNMDSFQITGSTKLYQLSTVGECIGPLLNVSIKRLYFYNSKYSHVLVNTFELKNHSNTSAIFQFDYNRKKQDQDIFKLDKERGTIEPCRHSFITVKFDVNKIGVYSQFLTCIIMNHPPIIIELVGIQATNFDNNLSKLTLIPYLQTTNEIDGYTDYMSDSVKITVLKPPFSLSTNYLHFGRMEFKKNCGVRCSLVTSLTNHLADQGIKVVWNNGKESVFSISPEEIVIPPNESVLYECRFTPDMPDQLYTKTLKGCVYWTNIHQTVKEIASLENVNIPLNVTLKVSGHSFPENKGWLPRVEIIPEVIILPPCMPMSPTYTTLMLKSSGHLPTLFKFIAPTKTYFTLKPMLGIIYDFQIVVVQLQPDANNKKAYAERWTLELNGRMEDCLAFYLKGYSEIPTIVVGDHNTVTFKTMYPHCQDILTVPVKNTSIHFLKYSFILDKDEYISIDYPEGQLASNETVYLQWYFTGSLKLPEVCIIRCNVQPMQKTKLIIGAPLDTFVTVYNKCAYSKLCATPNCHDFGKLLWGTTHKTEFSLFNFGESTIHFKLVPKNDETDNKQETNSNFQIIPAQGTVSPGEQMKITIQITVEKTGSQDMGIMYQVRLNEISDVVIEDGKGHDVFYVECFCLYPTLQIEDIGANNFGFLFSKIILWEMFKIDEMNQILREIEHDEIKTIEISLPDYQLGDAAFFATFVFRNITELSTELKFKRKKLCDCKPTAISKGISLRATSYDCIHTDMFNLTLSHDVVEANDIQILKMDVKYLEHGLTRSLYVISLSNNRTVNFFVHINVLPEIVTLVSKYTYNYKFELKNIFIGEKEPPAQVFPLYNNSAFPINYEIDIVPLASLNFDFDFEIFKCINPEGVVLPFSSKEILLRFTPIEVRKYSVEVPLKMEENEVLLQIYGEGVLTYDSYSSDLFTTTMPKSSKGLYIENPIELSVDYLDVEPFPAWSTIEKLLFIRNQTTDRIIGYSWQNCIVEGTIKAEAVYSKGVLQPKEHHAVIIRINSFDQPCCLRLQMACKLLDHTQHLQHVESLIAYDLRTKELEGQFVITEHGTFYPENELVILPEPENFFVTLAINLCITSIADQELCMNTEQQLKQSPQHSLSVNIIEIFKQYAQPLLPKKSGLNLDVLSKLDNTADQKNVKLQNNGEIILDKNNIKMFKQVVECLIADTVLSDLFCKVVEITSNSSLPYYQQFIMDDNENLNYSVSEIKEQTQKCLEKRMSLVEDFLNKPPAPFLSSIIKELLAESIHEVFHLGPQVKNETKKPYIYRSAITNFRCPSCNCNL